MGYNNTASGTYSMAQGQENTASGWASHAEGSSTTASGYYAHAEGVHTIARGEGSHAEGEYTTATHQSQHVFGEYNALDTSTATKDERGTYIEIVGNGTSDTARANARTLDWSGNEVLAGTLTTGGAIYEGGASLANKYLGKTATATKATGDGNGNNIANTYAKKTESADYLQAIYSDSTLTLKLLASRSISLSIQKIEGIASVDYVNNAINNAITTALGGDY